MARFRPSARRLLVAAVALAAVGLIGSHAWAWSRVRAARSAVERYHPAEAGRLLAAGRRVWGWDARPAVHLLASRACRQQDDFDGARRELHAAQTGLGGATEETAFEWALLEAAAGNVVEVEEYLQRKATQEPDAAPLVWEAIAQGQLRLYRILDAMAVLKLWLARDPDNPRALELRGRTYVTGKGVARGAEDYRRVLELDPGRTDTRRRLAIALLDLGGYPEAADHLGVLLRDAPGDPEATAMLARCYNFIGRRAEGRALLDAALERHPDDGLCLRTRGQIALHDDQKPEAERWLRRAVAVWPQDYQTQWLLFEALRQQGKEEEAKAQNAVADRVKEQNTRLTDLQSRKLAEFPLDPALHYEMGTLLTQTGRADVGVQWFRSAVSLDPDHRPSHAALAEYYRAAGDPARAEFHAKRAATPAAGQPR